MIPAAKRTIRVSKADQATDEPIDSVVISITETLQKHESLEDAAAHFDDEARDIHKALKSLPGGTKTRLTALLLQDAAELLSYRRVPQ